MSDALLPIRPAARVSRRTADPGWLGSGPDSPARTRLLRGAERWLAPGAFAHGVEIRHVRRLVQPFVDECFASGKHVGSLLGPAAAERSALHAANVTIVAVGVAAQLGLERSACADVGVAALLHGVARAEDGVRALLAGTTWSPLSLAVVQAAVVPPEGRKPSLVAQLVAAADDYVTSCSSESEDVRSDAGDVGSARLRAAARDRWLPAIAAALARAVAPLDPHEAERERPAA